MEDTTLTATVKIEGLSKSCKCEFSETGVTSNGIFDIFPIDEYSNLSLKDEFLRFDNLFITLENNPNASSYISFEIGKDEKISSVKKRLTKILSFLKKRDYDANRIIFDVCRSDKKSTTMWLVPVGAELPRFEECEKVLVNLF